MRHDFERNEQTVETLCLKQKEVLLKLYHIDKDIYHFIKFYLEYFSKFAFQEVTCPVMQPDIFWSPKTVGRVLGYITAISFQLTMQSFYLLK